MKKIWFDSSCLLFLLGLLTSCSTVKVDETKELDKNKPNTKQVEVKRIDSTNASIDLSNCRKNQGGEVTISSSPSKTHPCGDPLRTISPGEYKGETFLYDSLGKPIKVNAHFVLMIRPGTCIMTNIASDGLVLDKKSCAYLPERNLIWVSNPKIFFTIVKQSDIGFTTKIEYGKIISTDVTGEIKFVKKNK